MARTDEAERLVKLALCVRENPGISFAGIRERLPREYGTAGSGERDANSTRRRFERDKETLRDYGVFIVADGDRYRIDAERSYAAPVELSESETSLLRLVGNALLADPDYPFKNEMRMILVKLGDELDVPDLLPAMEGDAVTGDRPLSGLKKAREAIATRKRLLFSYRDAQGALSAREVEPFGCFLCNRHCYIVAYDPAAGGERVFRLDRMGKMRVNRKTPSRPDFDERPFDAADYYGLPFQFGSEDYEATVSFDGRNLWRADRLRMGQGALALDGEGALWTVRTRDTGELARWCVENGPGIKPVAPARAREAYQRGLERALCAQGGQDER